MRFDHPKILILWPVAMILLGIFLIWSWRKKQRLIRQFVQARLLPHLTVRVSRRWQLARLWLLTLATGLLGLALAQPQWGMAWQEAHQQGLDIVIAIDTSRSMLAEDISPNRLQRAKFAAIDLMNLAQNDRLGLVAFAGTAFLQCPLTLDDEAFRQSVNILEAGIIPQGGTSLAQAIDTAKNAFTEPENHKVIILFTDGEDHEKNAIEAAEAAGKSGIRIFTVGVGTANGDLLRYRTDAGGVDYIKDDAGNVVKSRLDEALLSQVATGTGGFYLPLSGSQPMEALYQRGIAPLPKSQLSTRSIQRYREQYYWFVGLAMILLLLELFLPAARADQKPGRPVSPSGGTLQKAVSILLLLSGTVSVSSSPAAAQRKYEQGRFQEARDEYNRLLTRNPNDPRLHYNAGAAAYQTGQFDEAARHFGAALTAPDLDLQQRSFYNLGNSFFRQGEQQTDPAQKRASWESALKQYEASLKLQPKDADTQFNLDYVKKKIEELDQQQKSQDKNQNDPSDDKDKKDDSKKDSQDNQQNDQNQQSDPKSDSQEPKDSDKPQKDQEQPDSPDSSENEPSKNDPKQDPSQDKKNSPSPDKMPPKPGEQPSDPSAQGAPEGDPLTPRPMTQEQVKRLLDSQKSDEKAMLFLPPASKRSRIFKDW